jgi:hypothetical protein
VAPWTAAPLDHQLHYAHTVHVAKTTQVELTAKRKAIGTREEVGALIDRSRETIRRFELPGAEIPAWYVIVIEELHRRKQQGRKLSPV